MRSVARLGNTAYFDGFQGGKGQINLCCVEGGEIYEMIGKEVVTEKELTILSQ